MGIFTKRKVDQLVETWVERASLPEHCIDCGKKRFSKIIVGCFSERTGEILAFELVNRCSCDLFNRKRKILTFPIYNLTEEEYSVLKNHYRKMPPWDIVVELKKRLGNK